ncbi:MAG: hypothetical protein AB7O26_17480 [Planctomycetaceae bacterium]
MRRIVLLGASNLTQSFPRIVGRIGGAWDGPLFVYAAHGHGRSYGRWSRVLVRSLPAITACGLWQDLDRDGNIDAPMSALITDVGNDLIYGSTPETISGWVAECCRRLAERRAEIVLTLLPMASVERLSAFRYHLTRAIFFPGSGPAWGDMQTRARELNARLLELGRHFDAHVIEPRGEWYGFDPIHVRRGARDAAWREILSRWPSFDAGRIGTPLRWNQGLHLLARPPAERRLLGRHQKAPQPSYQFGPVAVGLY